MPDEQLEFKSNLILALEAQGVENAAKAFEKIIKAEKKAGKSVDDLIDKYGSLDRATKVLAKAYKEKAKAITITEGRMGKLVKTTMKLTSGLKEAGFAFKKLVLPSSFGASLKTFDTYNKNLLSMSANVNRFGIGMGELEGTFARVSKQTSLTKVAVQQLFKEYEEGTRIISTGNFESITMRINKVVGSNVEAMSKMGNVIAEIASQYPGLGNEMAKIGKLTGEDKNNQIEMTRGIARNIAMTQEWSASKISQVAAFLGGNKQISEADKKSALASEKRIKTMEAFGKQMEKVQLAVAEAIMPVLEKIVPIMESITAKTFSWGKAIGGVGIGIAALMGARGLLGLAGKGIVGGVGKIITRGRGQIAGGVGKGLMGAASAGGGMGIPVFVTNLPGVMGGSRMMGGGSISGGIGAKGGYGAFLKKVGPKAGKSLGIGLALGLGSAMAKTGGELLTAKGHKKTGGAVGIGGNLMGVGSAAMTGAAIGSIIPGVGTAVGAVVGGIVGVAKEGKGLVKNFKSMLGPSKKQKEIIEDQLEAEKKNTEEVEKRNKITADANKLEADKLAMQVKQIGYAGKLGSLLQGQSNILSTIIGKMQITGKINKDLLNTEAERGIAIAKEKAKAWKRVGEILKDNGALTIDQVLAQENLSDIAKDFFEIEKKSNKEGGKALIARVATTEKMQEAKNEENKQTKEISDIRAGQISVYDKELEQSKLIAQQAELTVQMYDNMAIGVGATAEQRVKSIVAQKEILKTIKEQLKINATNREKAPGDVTLQNQQLDLLNQQRQVQLNMTQQAKVLRDGWVSALTATQTGFGGISEIIMDANNGLSLMMQQTGSVRSAYSGAAAKRGENVGFNAYERLSAFGRASGMPSIVSNRYGTSLSGKNKAAYRGTAFGEYDPRNMEKMMRTLIIRAEQVAYGGGTMLGAGNMMALAAEIARSPSNYNQTINQNNKIVLPNSGNTTEDAKALIKILKKFLAESNKNAPNWNQP